MTLKERARNWLGLPQTKPPLSAVDRQPPAALGGQRFRVSQDNPTISYLSGLTILAPFDPERRWRGGALDDNALNNLTTPQILDLLADLSPEISRALWDLLRLANPGWEVHAFRPGTETVDKRAQAAVDAFLGELKTIYGSVDTIINRLYIGAFLRGAFFAELVLDNAGRMPLDIAVPDAQWVYFRIRQDPARGPVWEPYQFQGGKPVSLERDTIRYLPIDPLPASPYGRPLASPALFTCLFTIGLLHDLRRVVAQQGYPRLDIAVELEKLLASMPEGLADDPAAVRKWLDDAVRTIGQAFQVLQPDDAYVHTDMIQVNRPVGAVNADSLGMIGPLVEALERMAMRSLKSTPLEMGLTGSSNETQSNRQWELRAAGAKSLQHLLEGLLEEFMTIALQVQGIQADVQWRFAELRAAELLRDAQVQQLQNTNAFFQYEAGWLTMDEACHIATGKAKSDQQEPRSLPQGFTAGGTTPPLPDAGQVQADPGSQRARLLEMLREDGVEFATNGNGRH